MGRTDAAAIPILAVQSQFGRHVFAIRTDKLYHGTAFAFG